MARNDMFSSPKSLLIIAACICFAIAVVTTAGIITLDAKINWTDLGLFFGFLSFILEVADRPQPWTRRLGTRLSRRDYDGLRSRQARASSLLSTSY